ncbi:hypothetical protein PsalMR5_04217 (plasmid) [Piscirickettsia salmonis]|uniref:DUF6933 domain-containing protein n=1 Tax=Piscirickettsia salmonis TaxID=1238 RepID=UPI0012BA6A27|nr:hypothetical protein [Piscirickettsia salmonis]QGP61656.1 hypothetical protein PsalBI1_04298 [Piscirickettsia salmonis]QGP66292.1 hypothetical protein PsalMR5_04217 [Piscirickettsia salmonis]
MFIFNLSKSAYNFFSVNQNYKKILLDKPPCKRLDGDAEFFKNDDGSPTLLMQLVVHVVDIEGEACIVVVDAKTRFSLVLVDLEEGALNQFFNQFIIRMSDAVNEYGLATNIFEKDFSELLLHNCLDQHRYAKFFKRNDQSVQGTLTDVVNHARRAFEDKGYLFKTVEDMIIFNQRMNKRPRNFKSKNNPKKIEQIFPEVELLIDWLKNYASATEGDLIKARIQIAQFTRRNFPQSVRTKLNSKVILLDDFRTKIVH